MTKLFIALSILAAPAFAYGDCKCVTLTCKAMANVLQALDFYAKPAALPPGAIKTGRLA